MSDETPQIPRECQRIARENAAECMSEKYMPEKQIRIYVA